MSGVESIATAVSIIGFSAQIFDGCVKGFVLLSTANNLGRDADVFRCMLDWEHFRLEQWAEKVGLSNPSAADPSLDWGLIESTLEHIRNLTNDTAVLKKKYGLILCEDTDSATLVESSKKTTRTNTFGSFKKLFAQPDKMSSTAAAKVIQSKNSPMKKLWWAAVDKNDLKRLIVDISHFTQRLYDLLNVFAQEQMKASIDTMIQTAIPRSENVLDLAVLRELAQLPDFLKSGTEPQEEIEERIARQSRNLLFWAVEKNDINEIEHLIDEGVSVESKDHIGWSPLIRAADYGQLASAKLLLRRGADPLHGTIGHRIPLHFAAENGYLDIVKVLLEKDKSQLNSLDHVQQTPLHKAVREKRNQVVEFLVSQNGIEVDSSDHNGFSPLINAIFNNDSKVVRMLLSFPNIRINHKTEEFEQTPLWMSVTGDPECSILRQLLEKPDIDVDQTARGGETPVYRAVRWSCHTALRLLIDHKADCNIPQNEGLTPLLIAAKQNDEAALQLLLQQAHTDPNLPDQKGSSPLMHASEENKIPCVRALLKHGVETEAVNNMGGTALSQAAVHGHKIPVKLLLKAGANINTQDSSGNTPLARAAAAKHDAVVRFLLENGADPDLADEDEETPFEKARDRHLDDVVKVFQEVLKLGSRSI
ncbi:MAG: hypothetical protein Q9195_004421 [Heterodermia aff. obscurata]